ncbi:isocitrate lyase/phosphoenolpyruvate mutase family protein [Asanoa siamensis]|uniref:Carboxyvinyl-carboxyphosphonate phosphorylmutase n=1 Tax=Asanoa siamensis TaxID=926357 RepID=A0ABQ4CYE8_9ACTN|nr:isocitrate lyase/phosphoenolpyruvate mutase family protein [Asanoa siamensis]GIF76299.1 carboxyvinyl-carboxyphosphonate phosphorylmutase [Asanoa siamensis]
MPGDDLVTVRSAAGRGTDGQDPRDQPADDHGQTSADHARTDQNGHDQNGHDQRRQEQSGQDQTGHDQSRHGQNRHDHRSAVDGVDVAPVPRAMLRDALSANELVVAPGCYDVVGARVLEAAGIEAAYLTPFGFQAADAPAPHAPDDPWERYLDRTRELVDAAGLAMIVDGQTGLEGNRSAAERAADAFEAGAAGFVIEDRLGFGKDRPLRTMAEIGREIATVRHEVGRETTVIVRTDAVRDSVTDARDRAESYLDAGADLVLPLMTRYLNYPDTPADRERRMSAYQFMLERVPANRIVVHSPTGRHLPVDEARRIGFGIYLMSQLLISSAVTGMTHEIAAVLADEPGPMPLLNPVDLAALTGVDRWLENRW